MYDRIKRLLIVFMLGFSSGLPLALVSTTLQAWYADVGMSLVATGLLSLISFPYVYRFLWAPILDRYPLISQLGKRRSWILVTQILLCIGFNVMAWLSPTTSPYLMAGVGFLMASLSATQDATIDAHRTEFLPSAEYGLGASLASLGYRLALLAAGGLALIIAHHAGWLIAYRTMGCLMIVGVVAILWSPEPPHEHNQDSLAISFVDPIKNLIARPHIILFCLFILVYKFGEAFTTSTSGIIMPFLIQGIGFSLETIAYVNKMLGIISIIVGGVVGGVILMRVDLYRSLLIFGLLQAITNVLFLLLAIQGKQIILFALATVADNFVAGMGSTAMVALLMRNVDQRFTATQLSILVAFSTLPRVFSGPVGALLQSAFGWVGLYEFALVISFAFIPLMFKLQRHDAFEVKDTRTINPVPS